VRPLLLPPGCATSEHLEKVRARFGGTLHAPVSLPPGLRLAFLCFTNRCGSNYLASLLATSGKLNAASEMLNAEEVCRVADQFGINSFQQYFAAIARHDMRSGVFLTKLAVPHLPLLVESGLLQHCRATAVFLLMERDDKLAQAISHAIASETESWTSAMPARRAPETLTFSRAAVAARLDAIVEDNRRFDAFFAYNGFIPTRIVYERLLAAPRPELDLIAQRLGLPALEVDPARVPIAPQAGHVNTDWRRLFLEEEERKR